MHKTQLFCAALAIYLTGNLLLPLSVFAQAASPLAEIRIQKITDDASRAGIVIAGQEQILSKFSFTASSTMTVRSLNLLVTPFPGVSATTTSPNAVDEVPRIKLFDGATQIGESDGYAVTPSGGDAGTVYINDNTTKGGFSWTLPAGATKVLTVVGMLNSIAAGADSGASVYASISPSGFLAEGEAGTDTTILGVTGNQKVVYKTKPLFGSVGPTSGHQLTAGTIPVLRFKLKADGPEQISWKQIQFRVAMTGATMSAVQANPGQNGNVTLKRVGASSNINIANAFSTAQSAIVGAQSPISGGQAGYVSLLLNSEEVIPAGFEQEYELSLTFANVSAVVGGSSVAINLHRTENEFSLVSAKTVAQVRASLGTATDAAPSFVWSDYSAINHAETTPDWANGVFVPGLPSAVVILSDGGVIPPPPPPDGGGIFSRFRNALIQVFSGIPTVDVKVKDYDAPEEAYADGPMTAVPDSWIRVKWETRTVSDCRINYWGLLPQDLGASAENNRGEPTSWRGNPTSYHVPDEEGIMEIEVVCAKDTDGFPLSDRVRINVEALTAGTAGGITPPSQPPQEGVLGRLRTNVRTFLGVTPEATVRLQPEETVPPIAGGAPVDETVPPIAGEVPEPDESIPPIAGIEPERAEPVGVIEPEQAEPVGGLRGLLNAIRRVPTAARDVVQNVIELVITGPRAPEPDLAEPRGGIVQPEPAEPVGIGEPERAEPVGSAPTEESIPPIAGIREPAQTVPPIAGIAIPSLTNNVLNLGRAQSITWRYQRGGEVQAPIVHLYLVGEGVNPRTGELVRRFAYIGQARGDAGSFTWSIPANFVKPLDPCCTFSYSIGIGLSANPADPQIQSTSNPITVEESKESIFEVVPPRTVEPSPPPPSTILEPETRIITPPPPPPSMILEPVLLSPTVDIKANNSDGPITIASGGSATISWTSANALSCAASNGWSGSKSASGSMSTGSLTASRTYTLTCSNRVGSASDSVTVNVGTLLQPRTRIFYYSPEKLQQIAGVFAQLLKLLSDLSSLERR